MRSSTPRTSRCWAAAAWTARSTARQGRSCSPNAAVSADARPATPRSRLPTVFRHATSYTRSVFLASAYRRSLEIAEAETLATIAFPSISTGVYGYPVKPAARIAVATSREYLQSTRKLREVIFCCFSATDLAVYEELLRT